MAQYGSGGPPRYTRGPSPDPRDRYSLPDQDQDRDPGRDEDDDGDGEELPPWAIPSTVRPRRAARPDHGAPEEEAPRRTETPPRRAGGRAQAARARRTRRRGVLLSVVVVVAAVIAGGVYLLLPGGASHTSSAGDFVTTYQRGELRAVPDSCGAISAGTLSTYLPGKTARVALSSLSGHSGSQCDWTLDHKPSYLLLDVDVQAYAPSGLATGDGSATAAATDAYAAAMQAKTHPPAATHQPRAQIITDHGLGQTAFSAFQVIKAGGDATYRVTLVARYRNVLVTVEFSGLNHAARGGYGPVTTSKLIAGASAAAKDALAGLR